VTGVHAGGRHEAPKKLPFGFVWQDQLGGLDPAGQLDPKLLAPAQMAVAGASPR